MTEQRAIFFDLEVYEKIEKQAKEQGRSIRKQAEFIIKEYLSK